MLLLFFSEKCLEISQILLGYLNLWAQLYNWLWDTYSIVFTLFWWMNRQCIVMWSNGKAHYFIYVHCCNIGWSWATKWASTFSSVHIMWKMTVPLEVFFFDIFLLLKISSVDHDVKYESKICCILFHLFNGVIFLCYLFFSGLGWPY